MLSDSSNTWKILTLNLGFNIMGNTVEGSEAPMVKYCQDKYINNEQLNHNGKKISRCTLNSVPLIVDHAVIFLQEVNLKYGKELENAIDRTSKIEKRRYGLYENTYFEGKWGMWILADYDTYGEGIDLTHPEFHLYAPREKNNFRALQAVYFPKVDALMINVHAPHTNQLQEALEFTLFRLQPLINIILGFSGKQGKEKRGKERRLTTVIVGGDFNDHNGLLLEDNFHLMIGGIKVKRSVNKELVPYTCCTDSNYKYRGDYILIGSQHEMIISSYEVPKGSDRRNAPVSDHDPLSATIIFGMDIVGHDFNQDSY